MSRTAPPKRCPACDLPPCVSFRLTNGADFLRCSRCLMGWWNWPPFDAADFYDSAYFTSSVASKGYDDYASLESGIRRTARGRLRRIASLLNRYTGPRRIADVGCGPGFFLDEARTLGWDGCGVEVSAYAVSMARSLGLEVRQASADDAGLDVASFDCVTLWDVIEHVCDPLEVLAGAARALKGGGVLALSTGDVTSLCARLSGRHWHLFNLPEHLYFFSPRSLSALLGRVGCRVIHIAREVNWVPIAYILERLLKSMPGVSLRGRALFGGKVVLPATLFDVVGVYAVRDR